MSALEDAARVANRACLFLRWNRDALVASFAEAGVVLDPTDRDLGGVELWALARATLAAPDPAGKSATIRLESY